ncbi:MAG: SH3 domain-containing protein [Anaerolineae bacterium]
MPTLETPTTPPPPPAPTETPTATNTPPPTSTSEPSGTPTPQSTATPAVPRAVASGETNLRAGPGVEYPVVGSLPAGGSAEIIGKNQAGTWLQLDSQSGDSAWIIADRVEITGPVDSLAVVVIPPTPTPAATATPVRPGLVADFESGSAWGIGIQNYGTLAPSREQAMVGASSGRLSYNFPAVTDNYVVFLAPNPIGIGGQPTGISAWVYGDGSRHFLNAWLQDAAGEVRAYSFGPVSHTGWQQMTAWFDDARGWPNGHISGGDNGRLDYPARLYALVLDGVPDGAASSGVVYLDDLMAITGAIPAPPAPPAPTPLPPPPGGATSGALLPGVPGLGQTAGAGGLLGLGALLGVWLAGPRLGRRGRDG